MLCKGCTQGAPVSDSSKARNGRVSRQIAIKIEQIATTAPDHRTYLRENRMQNKLFRGAATLGVCLLLMSASSFGQAVYGSIFGTITDTTGAVVPNATVTVTDTAKGTSVTAQSNASGEFTVEHLIPDVYDVKIAAQGFKGYTQTGIQLYADTSTKVAAALTIGDAAGESVTVSADAVPQLKTDRADVFNHLWSTTDSGPADRRPQLYQPAIAASRCTAAGLESCS